ncbi:dephospho-CoA kinase [Oceanicella actignis]|uniref:Dephospho-CoA kinase n=1 Tax=Oceanicella actignis TaxID=1189325 RepID=A0A1M7T250_9RHOB|nr:dephospho-CoA kinase [Oceanicella actignis]TYO88882.1 dephospho-CoA kinase [Oceanicella actignis]SET38610.1 dephospho-CoA kinase [Oceanicella actignis]SHN64788.1 dephospho-CoA kinase [Oceanicella actignis]
MRVLGLTGSIGMGKSTTAAMFADRGVPVWDADAAVARLYGPGGAAVEAVRAVAPGCVIDSAEGARVDRAALRAAVTADPSLIPRLEQAVHPLVGMDRARFLDEARAQGAPVAVCDIPLLFETGGDAAFDAVVVVSAPPEIQRSRVLARPGMSEETFRAILDRQMPDAQKRARADFVVDTGRGLDHARSRVGAILDAVRDGRLRDEEDRDA